MTPDEVAAQFAGRIACESALPDWAKAMISDWVRGAVGSAVAAERERCAAVADAVAASLLAKAREVATQGDALRAACERDGARLAAARIREGGAR